MTLEEKLLNLYADVYTNRMLLECSFYYSIEWRALYKLTHEYLYSGNYNHTTMQSPYSKGYGRIIARISSIESGFHSKGKKLHHGNIFDDLFIPLSINTYNKFARLLKCATINSFEEIPSCDTTTDITDHKNKLDEVLTTNITTRKGLNFVDAMTYFLIYSNVSGKSVTVLNTPPKERSAYPNNFLVGILDVVENKKFAISFSSMVLDYFSNILTKRIKEIESYPKKLRTSYSTAYRKLEHFVSEHNEFESITDILTEFEVNNCFDSLTSKTNSSGNIRISSETVALELQCLKDINKTIIPLCKTTLNRFYTQEKDAFCLPELSLSKNDIYEIMVGYTKEMYPKIAIGLANIIHTYICETLSSTLLVLSLLPEIDSALFEIMERSFETYKNNGPLFNLQ